MVKQTATDVADFLVRRAIEEDGGDLLTNLKLQKLLYYAQGCHLAIFDKPLFEESIEAWEHGPVVPEVYHQFKACGRRPIEDTFGDDVSLSDEAAEFLNVVLEKFGQYSASRLVGMTHQEEPWLSHYESGLNVEIDKKTMREFFKRHWIDPDVAIENDGFDDQVVAKIQTALQSASEEEGMSADEFEKWLESA